MPDEKNEGYELDLAYLLRILGGKAWMILLSGLVVALMLLGYARLCMTPMYSANAMFCVDNSTNGKFSSSQVQAAQYLANTYMVILESRTVLDAVLESTGLSYTREQLADMITSEAVNETEVFRVMVTSPDPAHSAAIANAIVEALPAKIAAALPGSAMYVVDEAVEDYRQVSPDYRRMTALGFALGMLLSGAAVVTMAVMDDSVRSEEYLQKTYAEIPLLTIIPDGGSYRSDTYTSYRQKGGR